MTTLERIGIEIGAGLVLIIAAALWWHLHNLSEQRQGALACIQQTTVTKEAARESIAVDDKAGAADIDAVVRGYDEKVLNLAQRNDDLSRRLSAASSLRANGVRDSAAAACTVAPDRGVPQSEGAAHERLGRIRADLKFLLDACDANQVKTEDLASLYDAVRQRAIDEQKKAPQ